MLAAFAGDTVLVQPIIDPDDLGRSPIDDLTIAERLADPDDGIRALAHDHHRRMRPTGSTPSEATPTAEPAGGLHD